MHSYFQLLLWLFGLLLSAVASGNDLVISRAFLVAPASPTLSQGYTDTVHWIRLSVKAPNSGTT